MARKRKRTRSPSSEQQKKRRADDAVRAFERMLEEGEDERMKKLMGVDNASESYSDE